MQAVSHFLRRGLAWLAVCCSSLLSLTPLAAGEPEAYRVPLRDDATLRSVLFLDDRHGWAVGDQGVIWHTTTGGAQWQRQESGTFDSLNDVIFFDERRGLAVGGATRPYALTSQGCLLRTLDGGATWQRDTQLMLPAIRSLRFVTPQQGWGVTASSALFPSGLVTTDDGGRSWTPVASGAPHVWTTADFVDPWRGAAAGPLGTLAVVRQRGLEDSRTPNLGLRGVRRLRFATPDRAWLVGEGGLVLVSEDQGRHWQVPPTDLRTLAGEECDFHTLAAHGDCCWIAGSPGSRIWFTPDAGRQWYALPTGQSLPIHDLTFLDEQRGWAVGALGLILATDDGGRTWRRQRPTPTRAALVALWTEPSTFPLEVLLRLSGAEGYTSHVEWLIRRDLEPGDPEQRTLDERGRSAVVACGAADGETAWRFPLRQSGLNESLEQVVGRWQRVSDGAAFEQGEAHLVRQLRTWRPDVVLVPAGAGEGGDPVGRLITQMVLRAVEQAADPTQHADLAARWGLEPWRVRRVLGLAPATQGGSIRQATAQLVPRLGGTLAEGTELPRSWLEREFREPPVEYGFQTLVDLAPHESGRDDFFSGLALSPGGEARRLLPPLPEDGFDLLRRTSQKHRHVQAILAEAGKTPAAGDQLLGQLADLTAGLDPRGAGNVLFECAEQAARQGQWVTALEIWHLLVTRDPDHPRSEAACGRLITLGGSAEVRWQINRRGLGGTVPAGGFDPLEAAAAAGKLLERRAPTALAEPGWQFPWAALQRARGYGRASERSLLNFTQGRPDDPWRRCALGEQWLAAPNAEPPKEVYRARRAPFKPRLDGRLDDPCWQAVQPAPLKGLGGDEGAWPAEVRIAYDESYLYLAGQARRAGPAAQQAATEARPRDADLSGHDRFEWLLDLDRDYATYYRFAVDERGWCAEELLAARDWNPSWFVAHGGDAESWTVEIAIPLGELAGDRPSERHAWSLGVQRVVPGHGFQSWTQPASTSILPQGFGLLLFE